MKFTDLINHFGSQAAIARSVGIGIGTVWAWKNADRVPPHWQYEFEDLTKGALKAERLRHRQGRQKTQRQDAR